MNESKKLFYDHTSIKIDGISINMSNITSIGFYDGDIGHTTPIMPIVTPTIAKPITMTATFKMNPEHWKELLNMCHHRKFNKRCFSCRKHL